MSSGRITGTHTGHTIAVLIVSAGDRRWLDGLYLDQPEEWDDPYWFFRW